MSEWLTPHYENVYYNKDEGNWAQVLRHRDSGALAFRYRVQDTLFCFSLWSEVGETAKPLFARFWRKHRLTRDPVLQDTQPWSSDVAEERPVKLKRKDEITDAVIYQTS